MPREGPKRTQKRTSRGFEHLKYIDKLGCPLGAFLEPSCGHPRPRWKAPGAPSGAREGPKAVPRGPRDSLKRPQEGIKRASKCLKLHCKIDPRLDPSWNPLGALRDRTGGPWRGPTRPEAGSSRARGRPKEGLKRAPWGPRDTQEGRSCMTKFVYDHSWPRSVSYRTTTVYTPLSWRIPSPSPLPPLIKATRQVAVLGRASRDTQSVNR